MRDGVIVVNVDGTVQLVNPAAQVMFDVPVDARYPATLIEIVRSHQIVSFWKSITTERQNDSAYLEISIGTRTIQAFGINLSEQQAGKVLMVFHDISDIRQLEQVRKDFVANVSHELRTPMASIKALVETIQESYKDDPTRTEYFLERIGIEIDILTQTIQELLELSRIESGKVPLKITAVSPADLIASAVSRMQPQAERAGITIEVAPYTEMPKVSADPERIEQVLVSLIHNAIKATPHGGTITLSASVVGEIVQFAITDTGCGIAPMDLERIFERFYKSDKSRTTPGTGLGLSIARHMIQQHGGKIWAESIETKGSTFYFTLPIAR
jgi:two-component system phosphate regulon sensor histidine kinase PhoR